MGPLKVMVNFCSDGGGPPGTGGGLSRSLRRVSRGILSELGKTMGGGKGGGGFAIFVGGKNGQVRGGC